MGYPGTPNITIASPRTVQRVPQGNRWQEFRGNLDTLEVPHRAYHDLILFLEVCRQIPRSGYIWIYHDISIYKSFWIFLEYPSSTPIMLCLHRMRKTTYLAAPIGQPQHDVPSPGATLWCLESTAAIATPGDRAATAAAGCAAPVAAAAAAAAEGGWTCPVSWWKSVDKSSLKRDFHGFSMSELLQPT